LSRRSFLDCDGMNETNFVTATVFLWYRKVHVLRVVVGCFAVGRDESSCRKMNDMSKAPS
jgi:hypothetical protein